MSRTCGPRDVISLGEASRVLLGVLQRRRQGEKSSNHVGQMKGSKGLMEDEYLSRRSCQWRIPAKQFWTTNTKTIYDETSPITRGKEQVILSVPKLKN
jgi:hypothetical protein